MSKAPETQDPIHAPRSRRLETLRGITRRDELARYFRASLQSIGIQYFMVIDAAPAEDNFSRALLLHNYPLRWIDRYARKHYFHNDPVALQCRESSTAFFWHEAEKRHAGHPHAAAIAREARDYGLAWGIGIPVREDERCNGWVSLAARQAAVTANALPDLQQFCTDVFFTARTLRQAANRRTTRLTEREKEVLMWCSIGRTSADIAKELGLAEATVVSHLQNAMVKLDANNRVQAVAEAIRLGIINF